MDISAVSSPRAGLPLPRLHAGDEVRVHVKVVEGDRERTQIFSGIVLKLHGKSAGDSTFTVRRVSYGVGVERTFHLRSPRLDRVEIVKHGKVARAKLYYLRERIGKKGRIKERLRPRGGATPGAEQEQAAPAEAEPASAAVEQPPA